VADAHRGAARSRSEPVAEVPDAPTVEDGPEQRAVDTDAARRIAALLDTLPERQREILVLRLVVGLSAEETAQAVGGTAGSVRVAQHRALGKLRTAVAGAGAAVGRGNEGSTGG
jgi:RNA polymerase sigma-70 factor (ECF subfamily)